jgi:hypothetical protein
MAQPMTEQPGEWLSIMEALKMSEPSLLAQQIASTMSQVPISNCGRVLAYALAIKYNLTAGKGEDHGIAREIAMMLFQVPDEGLFNIVAEAQNLSTIQANE